MTENTTASGAADSPKLRLLLDSFPEQSPRNFDPDAAIQLNEWGIAIVEELYRLRTLAAFAPVAPTFQQRVKPWMMECFGPEISADRNERNHRFFEESTELVQAGGMTRSEAHQLVDYVYGSPAGEPSQKVGGVMVTLAALCLANGLDMHAAAETELARIWTKVEAIRAKQAAKPKHSPLPQAAPVAPAPMHAVPKKKPLPDLMMASYHEAIGWNACVDAMHVAAAPKADHISEAGEKPAPLQQGEYPETLYEGGRESVDDALAVVESFGPGVQGLNDTFARQVLLGQEVRRLRAAYEQACQGRNDFRNLYRAARGAAQAAPLTDTFVQTVPDKCDRIVWRNNYYHLPTAAAPKADHIEDDLAMVPAPLQQGEHLPLPGGVFRIDPGSGGSIVGYSAGQMHAYADATCAARGQALRLLTQKEKDSLGRRAEGMDGNEWDQWVQEKFAQVNGLRVQGGSYEWDWE